MVVTISPSLSLYRMVVLPAASRPTSRHFQNQITHTSFNSKRTIKIPGVVSASALKSPLSIDYRTHAFPSCRRGQKGALTPRDPWLASVTGITGGEMRWSTAGTTAMDVRLQAESCALAVFACLLGCTWLSLRACVAQRAQRSADVSITRKMEAKRGYVFADTVRNRTAGMRRI
jgi:hypothetical protein